MSFLKHASISLGLGFVVTAPLTGIMLWEDAGRQRLPPENINGTLVRFDGINWSSTTRDMLRTFAVAVVVSESLWIVRTLVIAIKHRERRQGRTYRTTIVESLVIAIVVWSVTSVYLFLTLTATETLGFSSSAIGA